ncbi:hypothetical protein [Saccharothrix sp. ST-888]|uniref:hypothetical protein n=1 Tax=Saccharothrix sp. ST-888 TaxID=1427391 RepID=UPI000697B1D8|nr:hypothetical protein [Saccharothrix sp. ST-888]
MNDEAPLSRADQVRLYLATVQARMDPDQFRVLGRLVTGSVGLLTSRSDEIGIDIRAEDQVHLTPEVTDEFLVVMSILATGRMVQQVVDLGDGAATVLDTDAAADAVKVQEIREWTAEQRLRRGEADAVLRGIVDAPQT